MDILQKLGGRKFLMAIIVLGAAIYLEMNHANGLSPTMASFLIAIVGTFSVANYASTAKFTDSKGKQDPSLHNKVDAIQSIVSSTYNKDTETALVNMITSLHQNMAAVKDTTTQVGTAVINLNNQLMNLKRTS